VKKAYLGIVVITFLCVSFMSGNIETAKIYAQDKGSLNLNSSGPDQLAKVPGISKDLANEICKYREKHGPFKKPEDLLNVPKLTKDILKKMSVKSGPNGELFVPIKDKTGEPDDEEEPSLKPSKC